MLVALVYVFLVPFIAGSMWKERDLKICPMAVVNNVLTSRWVFNTKGSEEESGNIVERFKYYLVGCSSSRFTV